MQQQQDGPREPFKDVRDTINAGIGFAQAFCMPVRVWWTKSGTAGEMFFGGRLAVIGWLVVGIWPCLFPQHDPRPVYGFWIATTVLLLGHRFRHWRRKRKGYRPHSRFGGFSRLERLGGHNFARRALEPILTGTLGGLCLMWNEPLGMYLVWATFAMVLSTGFAYAMQESMVRRMSDARWDQEWLAEQMQEQERGQEKK